MGVCALNGVLNKTLKNRPKTAKALRVALSWRCQHCKIGFYIAPVKRMKYMVDGEFCLTRIAFLPFCNAKEPFRRSYFSQLRREKALFVKNEKIHHQSYLRAYKLNFRFLEKLSFFTLFL